MIYKMFDSEIEVHWENEWIKVKPMSNGTSKTVIFHRIASRETRGYGKRDVHLKNLVASCDPSRNIVSFRRKFAS